MNINDRQNNREKELKLISALVKASFIFLVLFLLSQYVSFNLIPENLFHLVLLFLSILSGVISGACLKMFYYSE